MKQEIILGFFFAGHRNQCWVMALLNKIGTNWQDVKDSGHAKETGNRFGKHQSVYSRNPEKLSNKSSSVHSDAAGRMPPHCLCPSLLSPGPGLPRKPFLLCSARAQILDSIYFSSSLFSWAQWCCRSFSQLFSLKEHSPHRTIVTPDPNFKFKEFLRHPEFQ